MPRVFCARRLSSKFKHPSTDHQSITSSCDPHLFPPFPLCLCPPNPVYKDPLPPRLLQHPTFLSRPPTLTTDDESNAHFTVTFQMQAACCVPARPRFPSPPPLPSSLKLEHECRVGFPYTSTARASNLKGSFGS